MSHATNGNVSINDDCYDQILHYFKEQFPRKEDLEQEIWKNKAYIRLMELLKKSDDKQKIRNAIILILTLFEDLPPDIFNTRGDNLKNLKTQEKNQLKSLLKQEFSTKS
jgi:hypothetical protein